MNNEITPAYAPNTTDRPIQECPIKEHEGLTWRTEFSVRQIRAMKRLEINTYGDICKHTAAEFLACSNFGENSLVHLREILSRHNLKLLGD
jgi:DNA-directed RNA polymerase alpha subunit